jgi:hypothetical protein
MTSADTEESKTSRPAEQIGQPIALSMFAVLYFYSFGLFLIYWAYKNFRSFRCPGPSKIGNAVFAVFLPLSLFRLQESLEWRARDLGTPIKLQKHLIAITFFADQFAAKYLTRTMPGWAPWLCDIFALLPLLAVQVKINELNRQQNPDTPALKKYNWLSRTIVTGLLFAYFAFNLSRVFGH